MATYKVIQDIEAEDKLLGPLSLKQFIYAILALICLYICFLLITKHVAFLTPMFLLPGLFCGFFAVPWSSQQPTEVWALAKIRFFLKPRRRIWDQSGIKELVTVTVPKKIERQLTNGLSQTEVRSRLTALANTIDSRGWAVKNVNVNMYGQPSQLAYEDASDRLIDVNAMPQEVPNFDVTAADDILDEKNNPVAQQFDAMITTQARNHRQQIMQQMAQAGQATTTTAPPVDYWFMNQSPSAPLAAGQAQFTQQAVMPGIPGAPASASAASAEEEAIAARAHAAMIQNNQQTYGHLHTLQLLSNQPTPQPVVNPQPPVTQQPDPAILELANNNDLNVATIARQATRAKEQPPNDEVVISLH